MYMIQAPQDAHTTTCISHTHTHTYTYLNIHIIQYMHHNVYTLQCTAIDVVILLYPLMCCKCKGLCHFAKLSTHVRGVVSTLWKTQLHSSDHCRCSPKQSATNLNALSTRVLCPHTWLSANVVCKVVVHSLCWDNA